MNSCMLKVIFIVMNLSSISQMLESDLKFINATAKNNSLLSNFPLFMFDL